MGTEAVVGDPPLTLVNGDAIQLFTGADDCTATGAGNLGSLLWLFQDTTSNRGPTEQDVSILESKAASHSQDFHDSDSGPRTMALGTDVAMSLAKMHQNGQHAGAGQGWAESPSSNTHGGGRAAGFLSSPRSPVSGDQPAGQPGPLRAPIRGLSLDDDDDDDDHQRRARDDDL